MFDTHYCIAGVFILRCVVLVRCGTGVLEVDVGLNGIEESKLTGQQTAVRVLWMWMRREMYDRYRYGI